MSRNRIALLRKQKGLSQEQLASKLSITQQRQSQIESGSVEPTTREITILMQEIGASFQDMFVADTSDGKCCGILITYTQLETNALTHIDPNFNTLIYGESGSREKVITNILKDNEGKDIYLFFNTTVGNQRYIMAYFHLDRVLHTGVHNEEISGLPECSAKHHDNLILVGDREKSKILSLPLLLDKKLALSLYSLGFEETEFLEESKELATISNKTRMHRQLSEADTKILLDKCFNRG